MKMNIDRAKKFCKENKLKFEDISEDMFLCSKIVETKAGSQKTNWKWETIKHRTAFAYQLICDGDVVLIGQYIGGRYHNPNTRFIFTSLILDEIRKNRLKNI